MDRRKRRHIEQYNDMVARLLPEKHMVREDGVRVLTRTVTFQVTEDCNLACFVAGTQILMADYNYKPIEDILVGDMVLGFPEEIDESSNFRLEPTRVTRLYSRKKQVRRIITNNGDSVICTDEHPFLNAKRKWVQAKDLFEDSVLIYFDRKNMKLDTCLVISNEVLDEVVDVYNLETEVHTYVAENYLVHNCTYCVSGDTEIRMADYSLKPIKDIKLGDKILGFDEYPGERKQTKVKEAVVEQLFQRTSNVLEVLFSSGERMRITPNHKVLVKRNKCNNKYDYCEIGKLKNGDTVYHLPINDDSLELFDVSFDDNYKIGYLIAMIKGDGSLKHYNRKDDGCDVFKFRIAVKDIEIINRCKKFLSDLHIPYYTKPYLVSKKHNLWQEAIFANTRYTYNILTDMINDNFMKNNSLSYYQGYLAGFYDAEGSISNERVVRICNTDKDMIQEGMTGLDLLHIPYIIEKDIKGTKNKPVKYNIRITDNLNAISSYRFIKSTSPSLPRKSFEKFLNYSPLKKTKIISITPLDEEIPVYNIGTSTHTYIANGIAVHNCYQGHKTKKAMSWETAKKAVDMILASTPENNPYINPEISPGIIIEFIGGEPFLEIELIDKIVDYFKSEARRLQHPWAEWFCVSICSNGVLYFDERVQRFLMKNRNNISFSVTIDGNKELHDSCRVFHDGKPSYDLAVAAAMDWMSRGYYMGSKITIAPGNVSFLYEALKHMIDLGYVEINANCVYEEGWEPRHAIVLYEEMKRISDYLFEHDLENEIFISLFEDTMFKPMDEEDNQNWCGGTCDMLCIDPDGNYSICIRYLPSSLGDDQPPIYLGNVDRGLVTTEEEKQTVKCMQCITRRSQSTDECFYCPIAKGCAWCFREGTMITTPYGFKAIEDISVGDLVITGSGNTKPVESINKRYTEDTVLIRATGCEPIYTTGEHPFLVRKLTENKSIQLYDEPKWVNASDVKPYDKIAKTIDGKDIEWVNVREVNTDIESYEVYNMSVADDHTYIANGVIVHNCSAYNYQVTGSVDQRVTYICIMHKARSLANAYFWNKYYRKHGDKDRFEIHCPDEWALEIISQDELNMLKELSKED